MGGIFGKNKRLCVLPKRVTFSKGKGKKPLETSPTFCDASTWTGENQFYSARIGRTPRGAELADAKLVLEAPAIESAAQAEWETGEQAAAPPAQPPEARLSVTATDTRGVQVLQDPEAKASREVVQCQELPEQPTQEAESARRSSQESSKMEAVVTPPGSSVPKEQLSSGDDEVMPLAQTRVKAEVHVSADGQGGPGKGHSALLESEPGAEQEAGAVCASEESCAEKTPQEGQKAALSAPEEPTEPREATTNAQRSAEEQAVEEVCAAQAPPDLQLEQGTEVSVTEKREKNGEEVAEVCDDGKTSKEVPHCLVATQAALQGEIQAGKGGKPEEH